MTVLPVVERELRVAARMSSTYRIRLVSALVAIIIAASIYFTEAGILTGRILFTSLSGLAFLFALTIGVWRASDCISEEKREGTLGLLFLTDLKGWDVVGGKLAANGLTAFYSLLAILPVLASGMLMGGVDVQFVWRIAVILVNTLFVSLAIGVFASAFSREDRRALSFASLLLVGLTVLPLVVFGIIQAKLGFRGGNPTYLEIMWPSPVYGLIGTFQEMWGGPRLFMDWWQSVLLIHGIGWFLLGLTVFHVPRSWQDKPVTAKGMKWRERVRRFSHGAWETQKQYRTHLLEINPIYWLAARDRLQPYYGYLFLLVAGLVWVWGWWKYPREWFENAMIMTTWILGLSFKFWVANVAGRQFAMDGRSGTLELILSTPLTIRRIVWGQVLALYRRFGGPLLAVMAVYLFFIVWPGISAWEKGYSSMGNLLPSIQAELRSNSETVLFIVIYAVFVVLDMAAIAVVAMWLGVKTKLPKKASGGAAGRILVLPWVGIYLTMMLMALAETFWGWRLRLDEYLFQWCWCIYGLAANLGFGGYAWYRLHKDFREMATHRAQVLPGRALGRLLGRMLRWKAG